MTEEKATNTTQERPLWRIEENRRRRVKNLAKIVAHPENWRVSDRHIKNHPWRESWSSKGR